MDPVGDAVRDLNREFGELITRISQIPRASLVRIEHLVALGDKEARIDITVELNGPFRIELGSMDPEDPREDINRRAGRDQEAPRA